MHLTVRRFPLAPAVFGYIRVSQAEGEGGLATQRRILHDHGLRDDRIFADVASGRSMRRPAWKQLRGILRPGDAVAVPRLDRNLSEGLRAVEELHSRGISIRSINEGLDTGDDSPTARLMLHMLLALAEWERETIRDRIKAGVDRAAAEGRTGGRPPARASGPSRSSINEVLDTGDDSPTARLMLHMLLALAEWERETIRDRIKAGVDRAAAEGRTGGRPPALSSEKLEAVRSFLENGGSVSAAARTSE